MAFINVEIERFTRKTYFNFWKIKMRALHVQQGLVKALKGKDSLTRLTKAGKMNLMSKAHNAVVLSLEDKVLNEVFKEKIANQVWKKLNEIDINKSSHNRLCLKQKLYSFNMLVSKSLVDQIGEFDVMVDDLESI